MKKFKTSLIVILVFFGGFSTWVMWQVGYSGIWMAGFDNPGSLQILMDLVIACFLICTWIYQDAKRRGHNPYPWLIATFFAGSLAPLFYLILRGQESSKSEFKNNTVQI